MLHPQSACRATRADDRRRHLIDVARKLFTEHGFHATGVAQIASASGIRVGQIYRDFSAKEDIVAAIVAEDVAAFLDEAGLAAALAAGDSAAIRGWIDRFVRFGKSDDKCRLSSEIAAEAARNNRIAAIQREVDTKLKTMLIRAFEALSPTVDCADRCAGTASLVLALGKGVMYRRLVDPDEEPTLMARVEEVVDRELAALLSPAG